MKLQQSLHLLLGVHVTMAFSSINGLAGCDQLCKDSLLDLLNHSVDLYGNEAVRKSRKPRSLEETSHLCLTRKRTLYANSTMLQQMLCDPIKSALANMAFTVTKCQLAAGTQFEISVCMPNKMLSRNDICFHDEMCPTYIHNSLRGRDSSTKTNSMGCMNQINSGQRLVCKAVADVKAYRQTTIIPITYTNWANQEAHIVLSLVTNHTSKCCGSLAWTGETNY